MSSCGVRDGNDAHGDGNSGSIPCVDAFQPIFPINDHSKYQNTVFYFHN